MSDENRLRTERFNLRLFEEEKKMLEFRAGELDLNPSDYLRKLILADTIAGSHRTMDKEQAEKIAYQVGKIGTNVNQIAYNTNAKSYTSKEDYKNLYDAFFDLLDVVINIPYFRNEEREEWQRRISILLDQL